MTFFVFGLQTHLEYYTIIAGSIGVAERGGAIFCANFLLFWGSSATPSMVWTRVPGRTLGETYGKGNLERGGSHQSHIIKTPLLFLTQHYNITENLCGGPSVKQANEQRRGGERNVPDRSPL